MRKAVGLAVLALAALAARRYVAMQDAMATVAPDLRNPLLPFVPAVHRRRLLPIFRMNARIPTPSGRGVTVTERHVGEPAVRVLITSPTESQPRRPGVLWTHGGGYIVGSPQLEAFGTGRLARDLGVVAVSRDYRPPTSPAPTWSSTEGAHRVSPSAPSAGRRIRRRCEWPWHGPTTGRRRSGPLRGARTRR